MSLSAEICSAMVRWFHSHKGLDVPVWLTDSLSIKPWYRAAAEFETLIKKNWWKYNYYTYYIYKLHCHSLAAVSEAVCVALLRDLPTILKLLPLCRWCKWCKSVQICPKSRKLRIHTSVTVCISSCVSKNIYRLLDMSDTNSRRLSLMVYTLAYAWFYWTFLGFSWFSDILHLYILMYLNL